MFSVVIPLYNKEQSIKSTIQSVLNQFYSEFEILVVNDGSTDGSIAKVNELNDARIRVINQPNSGVSNARNTGIIEAKNEWIAFLDGDDLWTNNHLDTIYSMMQKYPSERVYASSFKYSDGRKIYQNLRSEDVFIVSNYFAEATKERLMWTSVVVVHRECFKEAGFFDSRISRGEDLDMWFRLMKHNNLVKTNRITAIYRID